MSNRKKTNEKATMMSRMGFQEKDLQNPSHDDLCVWISQDKIQKLIIKKYILNEDILKIIQAQMNHKTEYYEDRLQYDMGKIDNKKHLESYKKCKLFLSKTINLDIDIEHNPGDWEKIVKAGNNFFIGFIDFYRRFYVFNRNWYNHKIGIDGYLFYEVKISPQPLGELLRQLNLYRENCIPFQRYIIPKNKIEREKKEQEELDRLKKYHFFVICENTSWVLEYKEIIEDNGWIVITPNDILK